MLNYKLFYMPEFSEDLEEAIYDWKNNQCIGAIKSHRHVRSVKDTIELLKGNPKMGPKVTRNYALLRKPTRRLIIGGYIVFYRIDKRHHIIYIGSFFYHTRKNVPF